tara:strand:+ start:540 stop:1010 length:471 start_codon:yes stop_codon:yes gene_type:complete
MKQIKTKDMKNKWHTSLMTILVEIDSLQYVFSTKTLKERKAILEVYKERFKDIFKLMEEEMSPTLKVKVKKNFYYGILYPWFKNQLHLINFLLGGVFSGPCNSFPSNSLKRVYLGHEEELNRIFDGILHFEGNANPLIEVTRVWKGDTTPKRIFTG